MRILPDAGVWQTLSLWDEGYAQRAKWFIQQAPCVETQWAAEPACWSSIARQRG